MCFQRSFCWMHGMSLLGVSFTCASQAADVIALALLAPKSVSTAPAQNKMTHLMRCGMQPSPRVVRSEAAGTGRATTPYVQRLDDNPPFCPQPLDSDRLARD